MTPDYVLTMARYNAWQNRMMKQALEALPARELRRDRGAFFGTPMATANHLLWADQVWMSRIIGGTRPPCGVEGSVDLTPTLAVWGAERFQADARLLRWAETVPAVALTGDLRWFSGVSGREQLRPLSQCIAHMFNHQAHHRGQIHAMLTAAGGEGWVSDLIFMPGQGPWL